MRTLLLFASDIADYSSGGSQRDNHLREALLSLGEVDTIIWRGGDPNTDKACWGAERVKSVMIPWSSSRLQRLRAFFTVRAVVRSALRERDYDLIVVRHFPRALAIPFSAHGKLIVDADDLRANDIEGSLRKRLIQVLRTATYGLIGARARHVWIVDHRDAENRAVPHGKSSLLHNTATAPQAKTQAPNCEARLLMVGLYAYPPNADGLLWFAAEVMPKLVERFPRLELHAIGKFFQPELKALKPPVIMRGFVENLAQEYAASDVVVCPIRSGSGTQIKVIEALMHGRPTVASEFSFNGFADQLVPDKHLLVAADADAFVEQVSRILTSPERFEAMAKEGKKASSAAYSVDAFKRHVISTVRASFPTAD